MKRHSAIFLVRNFQAEIRISCLQTFFGILVSGFRGRFSENKTHLGNCKRDYRTESALSANFNDTGNNGLWWALAVQLVGPGADPEI